MTSAVRVPTYHTCADIYERAGMEKVTFAKLYPTRWCPDPDVRIGHRPGWNPFRSMRWLRETGRIDVHGNPSRAFRAGRPLLNEEPPAWYAKRPVRLLTAHEAALVCDRERKTIRKMKLLGMGLKPVAMLGGTEGYALGEVIRTGLQFGWLDENEIPEIRRRFHRLTYLNEGPYARSVREYQRQNRRAA